MKIKDQSIFRIFLMLLIVGTNSAPFFLTASIKECCSSEILPMSEMPWGFWSEMWPNTLGKPIDTLLFFSYAFGYSAVYAFLFLVGFSASSKLLTDIRLSTYLRGQYLRIFLPSVVLMFSLYIFDILILHTAVEPYQLEEILLGSYHSGPKTISSPSWFLTILFCYYLLLPVLHVFLNSTKGKLFLQYTHPLVILGISTVCFFVLSQINTNHSYSPFDFLTWVLMGHLMGYGLNSRARKNSKLLKTGHSRLRVLIVFAITVTVMVALFISVLHAGTNQEFFRIYVSLALLLSFFWNYRNNHLAKWTKIRMFLRKLSDLNLIIMLIHYPLIVVLFGTGGIYVLPLEFTIVLYFIAVWVLSLAFQKIIVQRVTRLDIDL